MAKSFSWESEAMKLYFSPDFLILTMGFDFKWDVSISENPIFLSIDFIYASLSANLPANLS